MNKLYGKAELERRISMIKEKVFQSPSKYIQGRDVLKTLYRFSDQMGQTCLLILSKGGAERFRSVLDENEKNAEQSVFHRVVFDGECCLKGIDRLAEEAKKLQCDVIVGIGGGKVLDTAKAVAHFTNLPVIIAPTNAASDAPCSALSVVYKEDGSLDQLLLLKRNPDLVLVDSEIVAKSPAKLLSAGIGDALATYFEMKANWDTDADNFVGARISLAAKAIATQCYETLMEDGRKAFSAVKRGLCTLAVENVIEANILLSGIGFESGGTSAAHSINNGIAELPPTHAHFHGEKVAFALVCQLLLSDEPLELIEEIQAFLHDVDLPITLAELGVTDPTASDLNLIAAIANGDKLIHGMPKRLDEAAIIDAVLAADALGREFLEDC